MEDTLSQVRREYDLLRIEFEQMLAANEQTGKLHLVNYLRHYCIILFADLCREAKEILELLCMYLRINYFVLYIWTIIFIIIIIITAAEQSGNA